MGARIRISAVGICLVALGACAATPSGPEITDAPGETSLRRFNGLPVTLVDLQENRDGALFVARALMLLERELKPQAFETRGADLLLEQVARRHGPEMRVARDMWDAAENSPFGAGREEFHELGFYGGRTEETFGVRTGINDLRNYAERLLKSHADITPAGQLRAAWRRFSPEVRERRPGYLASAWRFELGGPVRAAVSLSDSLLGPFERSSVESAAESNLTGSLASHEGYVAPRELLELVMEGTGSPVSAAITALARAMQGHRGELPVTIDEGYISLDLAPQDREFLASALAGLSEGFADVASLPLRCDAFGVTFSYLVGRNEARAALGFARGPRGWVLRRFIYEPAAAWVMRRGGARLDLLALVAAAVQSPGDEQVIAPRPR